MRTLAVLQKEQGTRLRPLNLLLPCIREVVMSYGDVQTQLSAAMPASPSSYDERLKDYPYYCRGA